MELLLYKSRMDELHPKTFIPSRVNVGPWHPPSSQSHRHILLGPAGLSTIDSPFELPSAAAFVVFEERGVLAEELISGG